MKDINKCDCCGEIWNNDNLIKFDIGKYGLYICPDCLEDMTNGDMIKAIFPNWKIEHIRKMSGLNRYECNIDTINRISFYDDWWNAPYERS